MASQERLSYAQLLGGSAPSCPRPQPPDPSACSRQIAAINRHIDSLRKRIVAIQTILEKNAAQLQEAAAVSAHACAQLPALESALKAATESQKMDTLCLQLERTRDKLQRHVERTATASTSKSRTRQIEFETHALERERQLQTACDKIADALGEEKRMIDKLKDEVQKQRYLAGMEATVMHRTRVSALLKEKQAKVLKIAALENDKAKIRAVFAAAKEEFTVRQNEWIAERARKQEESAKFMASIEQQSTVKEEEKIAHTASRPKKQESNDIALCEQLITSLQQELDLVLSRYRLNRLELVDMSVQTNGVESNGQADTDASSETSTLDDGWIDVRRKKKGIATSMPPNVLKQQQLARRRIGYKQLQSLLPSFERLHISPPTLYGEIPYKIDILNMKKVKVLEKQENKALTRD